MNIISVDLPWKPDTERRRALAIAGLDGNVKIARASDDKELLGLARDSAEPESIILLDVPIDGCDNLDGEHFRPIDKAIAHQNISVLPASKAKNRGKKLKKRLLERDEKRLSVYEIYPYAIYKFLAYLKHKKLLEYLNFGKFDSLLDKRFRTTYKWSRKYKREKDRVQRIRNMRYLYSLLTDSSLGLTFSPPLHCPDISYTGKELNELCDEYDACLGAVVGLHFANNRSYAWIAGDTKTGNMLILADQWLVGQLRLEIPVYRLGQKEQRL